MFFRQNYKKSKLQFVDLVGKSRERHALKTYRGVLVLEKVISALSDENVDNNSIPYADSTLSKLFKGTYIHYKRATVLTEFNWNIFFVSLS